MNAPTNLVVPLYKPDFFEEAEIFLNMINVSVPLLVVEYLSMNFHSHFLNNTRFIQDWFDDYLSNLYFNLCDQYEMDKLDTCNLEELEFIDHRLKMLEDACNSFINNYHLESITDWIIENYYSIIVGEDVDIFGSIFDYENPITRINDKLGMITFHAKDAAEVNRMFNHVPTQPNPYKRSIRDYRNRLTNWDAR